MTMDEIIDFTTGLDGVLASRPGPGDGSPEISWGDTFFYYSPDGVVPANTQPFATLVTKDIPATKHRAWTGRAPSASTSPPGKRRSSAGPATHRASCPVRRSTPAPTTP